MCGIAGLVGQQPTSGAVLPAMLNRLAHRGPDDRGLWTDTENGVFLGHRRLAIIDLSPAGHQPMLSASGRYVMVFNGEIFNFNTLRADLAAAGHKPNWRGHSDTEVLLACIELWGMEPAVSRIEGQFAFAVWDRFNRTLTLVRDRMGEKPLYFGWIGADFVFASELKAFAAHPNWSVSVKSDCLAQFLRLGYYDGAQSIVSGVLRLPAGSLLTLRHTSLCQPKSWDELSSSVCNYWRLDQIAAEGVNSCRELSFNEASAELERRLLEAVRSQMVADVPIGAFLSGGIDSSLIVALMQKLSSRPAMTFCIGFDDPTHDEAPHARVVASQLGTDHHELRFDDRQALELVPILPEIFDEPLADPSQLPTLLVSKLARSHVSVALTGDGGDELFAGYARYPALLRYWELCERLPQVARLGVFCTIDSLANPNGWLNGLPGSLGSRITRFAARHHGRVLDELRQSQIGGPGAHLIRHPLAPGFFKATELSPLRQLQFADQCTYLPNNILMKVDRSGMSVSLETRAPMLDRSVVSLSWRMRDADLLSHGNGKLVLKDVLYRYLPRSLVDRPKQGFAPPIGQWLRGALRPWAESLLTELPPSLEAVIDKPSLNSMWRRHLSGRMDAGYALWRVLMYCAWIAKYGPRS